MKLFERKPRDDSILEREDELMSELYEEGSDMLVRLCRTNLEYALRRAFLLTKSVMNPSQNSFKKRIVRYALIPFIPLILSASFCENYENAERDIDSQTGRYIFRYND